MDTEKIMAAIFAATEIQKNDKAELGDYLAMYEHFLGMIRQKAKTQPTNYPART